jgi:hypothetical protein
VHSLVLSESFHAPGARCFACHRLVNFDQRCPGCGLATTPLSSLRDAIIGQARAHGASVEFVGGSADRWLQELGGIGAWTRC